MLNRTRAVMLRVTEEELAAITAARHEANQDWVPIATFIRRRLFEGIPAAGKSNGVARRPRSSPSATKHRKPARAASRRAKGKRK